MQIADELKNVETMLIEELAAVACRRATFAELVDQRDADIRRLTAESPVMPTPKEIRDRLRALLIRTSKSWRTIMRIVLGLLDLKVPCFKVE